MVKLSFTFLFVIVLACTCYASPPIEEPGSLKQDVDIESSEVSKAEGWCHLNLFFLTKIKVVQTFEFGLLNKNLK